MRFFCLTFCHQSIFLKTLLFFVKQLHKILSLVICLNTEMTNKNNFRQLSNYIYKFERFCIDSYLKLALLCHIDFMV